VTHPGPAFEFALRQHPSLRLVPALVLLWALISQSVFAQQTMADADWSQRELGSGVIWRHYLFDNLFGSKQSVSYIEADLNNANVAVNFPYLASSRQKTSAMVPAQFPTAKGAINGTYFDTTPGEGGHLTYLRVNNTVIPAGGPLFSPWGYEGAIATTAVTESIQQMPGGGWSNNVTHPNILACGPLVLINGTVPGAYLTSIGAHCTNRHPRSAVGITFTNKLIMLAVDGRTEMSAGVTCEELGEIMDQLGCDEGLNLDGGGSTTLWGAGEPYDGVLNYPSDNGAYDHLGERACSNAVAVTSTAPTPVTWDARLTGKTFSAFMENGTSQTVTLTYQNIGTGTWLAADTKVVLARPNPRTSAFYATSWPSSTQPAVMSPATVGPGQTATFSFVLQAPVLVSNAVYHEHFMLTRTGVGRIGPADSEAWMKISVQLPVMAGQTFIVESRSGGQNSAWYTDSGMADVGTDCTATSCTSGIGMRYGSTFRSVAGFKKATVAPEFPQGAFYNVYVAWGNGSSRRNPITYHVVRPGTTTTVQLDQTATADEWIQIGTAPFYFDGGYSGSVLMTNENIDVSGNMFAGAVKFEYVPAAPPDKIYQVGYLGSAAVKPVIDGIVGESEWNAASPAATGFVRHDNPLISSTEPASFQMLSDETYFYMLFRSTNAYLPGFAAPPDPYGFFDLGGDKFEFFLTPLGVNSPRFYRLLFCPNPTNGICYVWSQASVVKTTSAVAGTDWNQRGGAAYSYSGNQLAIEYRIPWAEFDYTDIDVSSSPANGNVWGIQPCMSNQVTAGNWEYVNWEPDGTGSFVYGEPFGALQFNKPPARVQDWQIY
jgi:Phosphodiester glycosidase